MKKKKTAMLIKNVGEKEIIKNIGEDKIIKYLEQKGLVAKMKRGEDAED